jgi:putative ABC transport system permease protein
MLILANIRKTKGHTLSLFIMFLIASLLLNAGLLICFNFSNYFNKITKELNTPDIYYIIPNNLYDDNVDNYITNHENIIEIQKEESYWAYAETEYINEMRQRVFLFNDADHSRDMAQWKFVGKHLPAEEMSIYLPYLFQLEGGYQLNDQIEMVFKDTKILFTIKGFFEDVFFCSPETGPMGIYLPHDTYEEITAKLADTCKATLVFADLKQVNKDIETGLRSMIKQESTSYQTDITSTMFTLDLTLIQMSRTIMANMISVMIVAFATIILLVCFIVVRFRINNSIEDDMIKIGSLKAIGYTSWQIILTIMMQFVLIALIGSIIGITLSYSATPVLSAVLAQQSGLMWVQGFDGFISTIALAVILFTVAMVAFVSSRRIRKLHPIIALRGGIVTHSFRKNYLPLDKAKGSLPFVFALKSILHNKKQSIMIAFILVAVSFAQTFAVVMFYNTTIDTKAFLETPGIELSNAIAVIKPGQDQLIEKIKAMKEVRKVQYIDESLIKIDNNEVSVHIMEDYSKKETHTVYQGRYPAHSNEIVLAGHLADMIGKTVGDNVVLKIGASEADFIITGLSQGAYMGGLNSSITYEGMLKLNPEFKQQTLNLYLKKGENAGKFVDKLDKLYGDALVYYLDVDKNMELGAGVYISIVSKVGIAILVITIAVVILVLYFVINSSVVRKKRELGIQKALGFTTFQLMNQLSLSFLPPIIFGVCIGILIGITQTNVIMSMAQSGMGIKEANFIITPVSITLFGLAIVIISYVTSMMITYRIRKISAYALVCE